MGGSVLGLRPQGCGGLMPSVETKRQLRSRDIAEFLCIMAEAGKIARNCTALKASWPLSLVKRRAKSKKISAISHVFLCVSADHTLRHQLWGETPWQVRNKTTVILAIICVFAERLCGPAAARFCRSVPCSGHRL